MPWLLAGGLITISSLLQDTSLVEDYLLPKFIAALVSVLAGIPLLYVSLQKPRIDLMDGLLVGCFLWALTSSSWAINTPDAMYESLKIWLLYSVFFTVRQLFVLNKEQTAHALTGATAAVGGIAALTLLAKLVGIAKDQSIDSNTVYLIQSISGHKNLLAAFILLLLPVLALTAFRYKNWVGMVCPSIAGILLIEFLILRGRASNGGLAAGALVALLLVLAVRLNTSRKTLWGAAAGLGLVALVTLGYFVFVPEAIFGLKNLGFSGSSGIERLHMWDKSAQLIREHLAQGVGMGNWRFTYPSVGIDGLLRAEDYDYQFQRPHNDFLWMLSETGLIGFALYYGAFVLAIGRGLKVVASPVNKITRLTAAVLVGGVVAYLVMSSSDFPRERIEHTVMLAVLLAWLTSLPTGQETPSRNIQLPKAATFGLVLAGSLFALFVCVQRYGLEQQSKQIINAEQRGDAAAVLKLCKGATSVWYDTTPMGSPIKLYEGYGHLMLKNSKESVISLEQALEASPYNQRILNNLGVAYLRLKQPDKAEETFKRALEITPRHDDSNHNLALVLFRQGRYQEAYEYESRLDADDERRLSLLPQIEAQLDAGK